MMPTRSLFDVRRFRITLACLLLFGFLSSVNGRQWLVFYAKEGLFNGVIRQSFGHLYFGMIQEDPNQKDALLAGFWGYYPLNGIQWEGYYGFMNGSIRNDWGADFQHAFAVEVDERVFLKCLQLIRRWDEMPYSLRARNCIHFIREIVHAVGGMKDPEGFYLLPNDYLAALQSQNKNLAYREGFDQYRSVAQVSHYDGRLAKKFFTFQKWKGFFKKYRQRRSTNQPTMNGDSTQVGSSGP
ncbi:MAG: hypothetical protein KBF37_00440 [Saprospiraceae bacterium]|jgi:hypothetical protein|nr:hypothetical protein [Saprospiraceae bacterium]MBP9208762.1 hypothetical protein [Saprospiraceae bacterium]